MPPRKRKKQPQTIILDVPFDSDLALRIGKISEQTKLSLPDLVQKWVLQEESLIGLMRYGKEQMPAQTDGEYPSTDQRQATDVQEEDETAEDGPGSPNYRKMLFKRAKKLRKEGITLRGIAETFNEEKLPTVSGTGKWYTSSITWLMNSKL